MTVSVGAQWASMCVATLEPHAFSALSNAFASHPPLANRSDANF